MSKTLFIVIFNIVLIRTLAGQSLSEIKIFADDQYERCNYDAALKEYQRIQLFDTFYLYKDIYLKVATIYRINSEYKKAIRFYNIAVKVTEDDSLRNEIIFDKVECYFIKSEYLLALNDLYDVKNSRSKYFDNKLNLYKAISFYGLEELEESKQYFSSIIDSSRLDTLISLFDHYSKIKKRYKPSKFEIISKIMPGMGQIVLGNYGSGIKSLMLIGSGMYLSTITALNYGLIDGGILLSSFYRYYIGGADNAKKEAQTKILQEKSHIYNQIIHLVINSYKFST